MIRAMIFDLDGTLVKTERLKALSYARAAVKLCPEIDKVDVYEAFQDVVGLSRNKVAKALVNRFHLAERARERMPEFGVQTPWQAFIQVRLNIYHEMLVDPAVIRENQWPHTMALLTQAKQANCKVGLATMSSCQQTRRVLEILEMFDVFDFVASRDDVEKGKPDPEIYFLVADELNVTPAECLVIEDSPTGVKAGLNAGMQVVAVSTPFTQKIIHQSNLLPSTHIVDDPDELHKIVAHIMDQTKVN
jgi:HAD superfamily hydrolase (TIGR01509 family)